MSLRSMTFPPYLKQKTFLMLLQTTGNVSPLNGDTKAMIQIHQVTLMCFSFSEGGMKIKWVDNTHALGIFSNQLAGIVFFVFVSFYMLRIIKHCLMTFNLILFSYTGTFYWTSTIEDPYSARGEWESKVESSQTSRYK